MSTTVDETVYPDQLPIPRGPKLITSIGPGLVLAMTFLGTGDLISSSTQGTNYGYTLLWAFVLALVARVFIISSIAKYTLMNRFGDTQILEGFGRLAKWLPGVMAVVVLIAGFVTQATFVKASAQGLYQMTGGSWGGGWGILVCGLVTVGAALYILSRKKAFTILEYVARFAAVAMILAYLVALVKIGHIDLVGLLKGLFTFQTPAEQTGAFAPLLLLGTTVGTIAGNMPNLLYSGFMRDKGWVGPKYRRLQQLDLVSGMLPLLIINMLFWIVAAEYARGGSIELNTADDLSRMMSTLLGPAGSFLLWLAIFGAAMTSFPPQARGFAQLALNGFHLSAPSGRQWLGRDEEDPKFRWVQIGLFTLVPIISCVPGAPDLVVLSVLGTALSTVLSLPIIVVALFVLTSFKRYMYAYAVNRLWQTILLGILGVVALVVGAQILVELPGEFVKALGG